MNDPVLGNITFTEVRGWQGTYTHPFFGHAVTVPLTLGGWHESEPPEPGQRSAVEHFNARKDELCVAAEDAIWRHYLERAPELREQFGAGADELMPIIDHKNQITRLVKPTNFFVPLAFSDDRVIGVLYDCTWEPELGLAVKFVNETIDEVGPQDIVL